MQPSHKSFQKPARRAFEDGGSPGSLLLGNSADMSMPTVGYANGGMLGSLMRLTGLAEDTPERKAYKAAREAEKAAREAEKAAAKATPAPAPKDMPAPMGSQSVLDRRMRAAGLANGGKIKGPGTTTSDSIPAQVAQTGEPIKVSTGERIVSAAQDALLQKIAKARGYKSVDHMFEAETGKPVGPTIKGGQMAAVDGARPLDEQAERDRKVISGAWNTVKDANQRAGAVIADVATVIPRGLAGAYDSAIIRPMRAAGINADYMSPKISPDGADPASMTPFYDKFRTADAAKAPATPATADQAQANPKPAPTVAPLTVQPAPEGYNQGQQKHQGNADYNSMLASAPADLSALPENRIYKTTGKSGNPIYSGVNVGADAPMVDGTGNALKGKGTFNVMPAMDPALIKQTLTNPDGSQWSAGDNAIMAANMRDGVDPYRGTSRAPKVDPIEQKYNEIMNTPMSKNKRTGMVQALQAYAQATSQGAQTASQDKRYAETNKIAQGNLDISQKDHIFKQDQAKQLATAQEAYANPKATPEQREAARLKLIALGALKENGEKYITNVVKNPDGSEQLVVTNSGTGEIKGGQQGAQAALLPPKDKLVKGQTYPTPRGNAVWDGKQFTPV